MKRDYKLYESLGELIYAVAKADGRIQEVELRTLDELIRGHKWEERIRWSFQFERNKNSDPEQIYKKVINNCESYGPAPEYLEFIDLITKVAESSDGIDSNEEKVIHSFSHDLIERFKKDIRRIGVT